MFAMMYWLEFTRVFWVVGMVLLNSIRLPARL